MDNKILKQLADNPPLFEAVRHSIYAKFAQNEVSLSMPNEAIGQVVRANIMGRAIVDEAFKDILNYKTQPQTAEKTNPAR